MLGWLFCLPLYAFPGRLHYALLMARCPPGCHVLAHESFEDPGTADIMNKYFVNIKVRLGWLVHRVVKLIPNVLQVDREERPDVDRLYMTFLQATSGGGGWPMSVCMHHKTS